MPKQEKKRLSDDLEEVEKRGEIGGQFPEDAEQKGDDESPAGEPGKKG